MLVVSGEAVHVVGITVHDDERARVPIVRRFIALANEGMISGNQVSKFIGLGSIGTIRFISDRVLSLFPARGTLRFRLTANLACRELRKMSELIVLVATCP